MIQYILISSLCWIVLLANYLLWLKNDKFHALKRTYLISSLLIGLFIPLSPVIYSDIIVQLSQHNILFQLPTIEIPIQKSLIPVSLIAFLVYAALVIYQLLKTSLYVVRLKQEINSSHIRLKQGIQYYESQNAISPCSFWNWIVIPNRLYSDAQLNMILDHEQAHVQQKHTLDIIFISILKIVFPFHPLLSLYLHEIKLVHEFQVDNALSNSHETEDYIALLIHEAKSAQQIKHSNIALYHSFIYSPLKHRIQMMYRHSPNAFRFKYLSFPLLICLLFVTTKMQSYPTTTQDPIALTTTIGDPAVMPEFPGGFSALITFITNELKYPKAAKDAKTEGIVVVEFTVEKNGRISKPSIKKALSKECDKEVIRIVNNMPKWIPAKSKENKAVAVKMTLPIKFALD